MSNDRLKVGDKIQTGVYVCGRWVATSAGIIVGQSWDGTVSDVDIMSLHGGSPWIIKESTADLREHQPTTETQGILNE